MSVNLIKPSSGTVADPAQLLTMLVRMFDALTALQQSSVTPETVAANVGASQVVVLRGATVTLPGSTATFVADLYVTGIKV